MSATSRYLLFNRNFLIRFTLPIAKFHFFKHEFTRIYFKNTNYIKRKYQKYGQFLKKEIMDNPARTSTVVLENFYVQVANFYKNSSYKLVKNFFKSETGLWACRITVQWPNTQEFYAEESKKTEAARIASFLAIEWLKNQNKIDSDGRPLLVNQLNKALNLQLNTDVFNNLRYLSQKYEEKIKHIYEEYDRVHTTDNKRYYEDTDIPSYSNISESQRAERNYKLFNKLNEAPLKRSLPIDKLNREIVNIIENNRVVVIKGATGSGKTTRVPQLLLDNYIKQNRGVDCNIAISQPRRISATSLAARIASERNENLGFSVGHHVRFSLIYPPEPGTIMFLSTGILLQRLLLDPLLNDISHVIIDEAHERDINIDLLLLLMKELIEKNNKIRIIIMSATINAELFQQYFNNCPLLSIPGFMYKVHTYFIDDKIMNQHFIKHSNEVDETDVNDNLILDVVYWIHRNKPPGAILVFLPGWSDIVKIQRILQQNHDLFVLTAHSKLKIEQQQLIFERPPERKRKVILATNIAESSITIPDIVYVVDSGIVREAGIYNGVQGLANSWISKAVADQRQGRAGRLREGECYRLYSRSKYETFNTFPIPDVLRIPLESLVIHVKACRDDKVWDTLYKFPEKPPENTVKEAIIYLQQINVLDRNENLTSLGRRIAMFGLHPLLSAALVYSVFFGCIDPMLLITSYLNGDGSIFGIDMKSSKRRSVLCESNPTNDILAIYNIYNTWKKNMTIPFIKQEDASCLNIKSMETFKRVLRLNMDYLFKVHLVSPDEILKLEDGSLSDGTDLQLIAPVLLAATGRLAINAKPYFTNGKVNHYLSTLDGFKVQIASDSVNFKNRMRYPFLTFYNMNTTEGFLRIYDTAQVSPAAVVLLCPTSPHVYYSNEPGIVGISYPNIDLQITAKRDEVQALLHFREIIWNSLNFFVSYYDTCAPEIEEVRIFRNEIRNILSKVLNTTN